MQMFVMPAWIAGIQVRKEVSGNIHVNLDSSTPCWNDAIEALLKLTETFQSAGSSSWLISPAKFCLPSPLNIFKEAPEAHEGFGN